jgi:hypothetical protein
VTSRNQQSGTTTPTPHHATKPGHGLPRGFWAVLLVVEVMGLVTAVVSYATADAVTGTVAMIAIVIVFVSAKYLHAARKRCVREESDRHPVESRNQPAP